MPDEDDVKSVVKGQERFLGGRVKDHQKRLRKAIKDLEKSMIEQMKKLKTRGGRLEGVKVNIKQLQKIHSDLTKVFEDEYGKVVKSILKDYDDVEGLIKRSFKKYDIATEFTGVDRTIINTLKESVFDEYIQFGDAAQQRVIDEMYTQVLAGGRFGELVNTMTGIFVGHEDIRGRPMAQHAQTHAFDGIMNFHNEVNMQKAEEAGLTSFLYMGNIIKTSRQFCRTRAGKVFTKTEIESWNDLDWQGKRGPPLTYRGGWNCRHHWTPVDPEWIDEEEVEIQEFGLKEEKPEKKPEA